MSARFTVGYEDFETLIKKGSPYIDKTSYLKELFGEKVHDNGETYEDYVSLFTRPSRFGKTLTMSMIKNFFELNYDNPADKSKPKELFKNLEISQDKVFCDKYMGEYPVISISLKGVFGEDYIEALTALFNRIGDLYKQYSFLKQSSLAPEDKEKFSKIVQLAKNGQIITFSNPDVKNNITLLVKSSLKDLTSYLYSIYRKKVIVLVDEYDVPLQKATVYGYYKEMLNVIRGMFEEVFKTNEYLEKGIVTGCLRISHESIYTGINNFSLYTIQDELYRDFIGFTHKEVTELLKKRNLQEREKDVLEWYDGYNFAGTKMLCPWSVLSFCHKANSSENPLTFTPGNYFNNTSSNDIVSICINHPDAIDSQRLQNLLDGGTEIILPPDFTTYPEISIHTDFDTMMGMMLYTGYLTVVKTNEDGSIEVKIPNKEVLDCFSQKAKIIFSKRNSQWYSKVAELKNALFAENKDKVQNLINELLLTFVSIRNTAYEDYYHGFLAGILALTIDQNTEIKSDTESGDGYADLILDYSPKKEVVIIEFKKLYKGESFDEICKGALEQIELKKYASPYEQKNYRIIKYGISFLGKECVVAMN